MNASAASRILYWTPRLLGLGFSAFLAMFALDVFQEHLGVLRTLTALAIHLIPSALMLLAVLVAWRYELAGAAILTAFGVLYALRVPTRLSWIVVVAGPMWLLAVLFLASHVQRRRLSRSAA